MITKLTKTSSIRNENIYTSNKYKDWSVDEQIETIIKELEDLSTFSDELSNYHVSQINKLFAIIMNL